jgi:Acetyltransferase (GNAT) domain
VSAQIRTCGPDEVVHALAPIMHFFGQRPTEEGTRRMLRTLEPERMHAAFEGDAIVGGAGAFSFDLSVPGGRVPAAGVTVVAVLPTHR